VIVVQGKSCRSLIELRHVKATIWGGLANKSEVESRSIRVRQVNAAEWAEGSDLRIVELMTSRGISPTRNVSTKRTALPVLNS